MVNKTKRVIGWKEKVDFVDFDLHDVDAKIDTGATTSVLHCSSIALVKRYRKQYVKFTPLDAKISCFNGKEFTLPYHKEKRIRNSFGEEENRFIVLTKVKLFGKLYEMEISLRNRENLEFPVLLGRSFVRGRFLVDVAKANLSYKRKLKKAKKTKESLQKS